MRACMRACVRACVYIYIYIYMCVCVCVVRAGMRKDECGWVIKIGILVSCASCAVHSF